MNVSNALTEKLKTFFAPMPDIVLVMLYGSYARGKQTEKSDVDIALASARGEISFDEILTLQKNLSVYLEKEIDLVDIRKIEGPLQYCIFSEGVCVKKTEGLGKTLLHKNILTALYWYEDYFPIYERSQKRILEKAFLA